MVKQPIQTHHVGFMLKPPFPRRFNVESMWCVCRDKPILRLAANIDDTSGVSNAIRRAKVSVNKTPVSCPKFIKLYNNGMGGVDTVDQKSKTATYRLDSKSKFHFYLIMFSNLIDVALVNSHIVYTKLGNDVSLLNFKTVVAMFGIYSSRK